MPIVGFGTWRLRVRQAYESVRFALELGYRHIDTATMYGNEAEIGRALRDSGVDRHEVFLTTKLPAGNVGRERETLASSLRGLGIDYVDLWLVHWPPRAGARPQTWREFLAVREQGLARAVGVSNYSIGQIDELVDATGQAPAVDQIPWSPRKHDPGPAGRSPRPWRGRRGIQPAQGHRSARPGSCRDRVQARGHTRSGRAALAHRAWDRRHPEVRSSGSASPRISTCSASPSIQARSPASKTRRTASWPRPALLHGPAAAQQIGAKEHRACETSKRRPRG